MTEGTPRIFIRAAGGVGAQGTPLAHLAGPVDRDAEPLPLRTLIQALDITLPRLMSRFAQLAVLGAAHCLKALATPLAPQTPLLLATGLGDIARTNALSDEVMPPSGEMASPAAFAASGNNLPAFLVAQLAGLSSRNLTLSRADLSVEQVMVRAIADLRTSGAGAVLCGSVDETTAPRERYLHRYPAAEHRPIGEGSAWWVLTHDAKVAAGELLHASFIPARDAAGVDALARELASTSLDAPALWLGSGVTSGEADVWQARLGATQVAADDLHFGRFPTAAGLAFARSFTVMDTESRDYVHVNRETSGTMAVLAWKVYGID